MAIPTATNHWKLGLFVVVAITAAAAAVFWLGANRFHRDSFQAVTYFDESVQGLDVGSPVKFRGVTIGTVSDITIAPDHRLVQVTADIYVDAIVRLGLRVPRAQPGEPFIDPSLRVQLVSAGITGVRFLQTDFFDPERNPAPTLPFRPPWNYVPSTASTLKGLEDSAVEILARFPAVEDGLVQTTVDLRKTLASVDRLANGLAAENGSWNELLVQLRSAAAHVEKAVDEARLGATTTALRDATASLGDAATRTSDDVDELKDELRESLAALRDALDSVRTLADSLERDPSVIVRGPRADEPAHPEAP